MGFFGSFIEEKGIPNVHAKIIARLGLFACMGAYW